MQFVCEDRALIEQPFIDITKQERMRPLSKHQQQSLIVAGSQASSAKPEPALVDLMLRAHSQFVDGLDLARLADVSGDVLRHTIRNAATTACDAVCAQEGATFSPSEREWLLESVLDQAFGFGPLEALLIPCQARRPLRVPTCRAGPFRRSCSSGHHRVAARVRATGASLLACRFPAAWSARPRLWSVDLR